MGLHKLSVGDGYTYLTRQVAAHDTDVEPGGLGAYYAERGESPGRWLGTGLDTLGVTADSEVTEAQMTALFGHGHHPPKSDAGRRTIALPPTLLAELLVHRKAQAAERLAALCWEDGGWMFPNEVGGPIDQHRATTTTGAPSA